jgi:putative methyltransferase (TIGR04325 family)
MKLRTAVKQKLKEAIFLLPYGRDIYLYMWRKRIGISYRGFFHSFDAANQAISHKKANQYDTINKNKTSQIEQERNSLEKWFFDEDYPVLFWLTKHLRKNEVVVELGGSVGHSFYSFEKFGPYPEGIRWYIAELPEAVKLGETLAREKNESRLTFIDSSDIGETAAADIFFTAGTLQYMKDELPKILRSLPRLPQHVIVHNLPSHPLQSYWTTQYLDICEVPYRITSTKHLVQAMLELGYEIVDRWKKERQVEIPFHRNLQVEGYLGYCFKLTHNPKK